MAKVKKDERGRFVAVERIYRPTGPRSGVLVAAPGQVVSDELVAELGLDEAPKVAKASKKAVRTAKKSAPKNDD